MEINRRSIASYCKHLMKAISQSAVGGGKKRKKKKGLVPAWLSREIPKDSLLYITSMVLETKSRGMRVSKEMIQKEYAVQMFAYDVKSLFTCLSNEDMRGSGMAAWNFERPKAIHTKR